MLSTIIARLREPSTYAGIAGVVAGLSFIPHAADIAQTVTAVGAAAVSLLAIWLPETKTGA